MAESADNYEAALAAEYAKYVATAPIFIDGTRAFNPGDPVPVSHVEPDDRHGLKRDGVVQEVPTPTSERQAAPAPKNES